VGSPIYRCFKLFLSIVLSTSRPLTVMSLDPQSVCLALQSPPILVEDKQPKLLRDRLSKKKHYHKRAETSFFVGFVEEISMNCILEMCNMQCHRALICTIL
jgi:hypothetical protein